LLKTDETGTAMTDVAYLGLGMMGRGMVRNLLKAGHTVHGWNRSAVELPDEVASHPNFRRATSVADAVAGRDRIMLCVTGPAAQRAVLTGPDGAYAHCAPGAIVADITTTSPEATQEMADAAAAAGHVYLDAPVYGSTPHAWEGQLGFIVGGPDEAVAAFRPLLEPLSVKITAMGASGSATVMKLIGNQQLLAMLVGLGEGLAIARKHNLRPEGITEVLDSLGLSSATMRGVVRKTLADDYSPMFYLKHLLKDADLVLSVARGAAVPAPGTAVGTELLRAAVNAGWGELHCSSVHKLIFRNAGLPE
jgi:3-hydroxyisobutyrate dehydrogenase-like beta-hydroxyacid dehydrogenase